uniref:Reverse transcriptase domain-containing protein n=1 Tax=Rhodopseudomonas palustris (strain BisA53) TaxID=316055 RepID=Q07KQ6_RHOP5
MTNTKDDAPPTPNSGTAPTHKLGDLPWNLTTNLKALTHGDLCKAILGRGYFPKELPPPFQTHSLADCHATLESDWQNVLLKQSKRERNNHPRPSHPILFDMARKGHARRTLAIPNPINQTRLVEEISKHWTQLTDIISKSSLSLTKCEVSNSGRAIPLPPLSVLAEKRIVLYAARGAILQTDILSFYHSVYSHAIPWAIHGKAFAKSNRTDPSLLGNRLDALVRSCQDGQTIGLPVGPDTSRIISEVLLCAVEARIPSKVGSRITGGYRYIDDFFLCFDSLAEAEVGLAALRESCLHFDLRLNPTKTHTIHALDFNEETWATEIASMRIGMRGKDQRQSLMRFFSNTIRLSKTLPDESIANFAVRKTAKILIERENWDIYESFILRVARENSNCIDSVVKILCTYAAIGYHLSDSVGSFIERTIADHAPYNHHYEVAWALWLALSLKIRLSANSTTHILRMENDICGLLTLHLRAKRLLSGKRQSFSWIDTVGSQDLYSDHWLLVYESTLHKKWTLDGAVEAVKGDEFFNTMTALNISFYEPKTYNRPINLPGIRSKLRDALNERKRAILPGAIHALREDLSSGDEFYEELGGDYGDFDPDFRLWQSFPDDDEDINL